ncbi:hypothetical protein EVAR_29881_1 [Eumeta japonica]|uniref:Uncharacterized protein n=1 Tax=Eumeta variegata TaxID=151549 RepID=A0A4C1V7N0_EUMVA|nr:hypothetical protein EVAR_29881_1 [Eumeta japonica]
MFKVSDIRQSVWQKETKSEYNKKCIVVSSFNIKLISLQVLKTYSSGRVNGKLADSTTYWSRHLILALPELDDNAQGHRRPPGVTSDVIAYMRPYRLIGFIAVTLNSTLSLFRACTRRTVTVEGDGSEHPLTSTADRRMIFFLPRVEIEGAGRGVFTALPPEPCQLSGGTLYLGCAVNIRSKYGRPAPALPLLGAGGGRAGGKLKVHRGPGVSSRRFRALSLFKFDRDSSVGNCEEFQM